MPITHLYVERFSLTSDQPFESVVAKVKVASDTRTCQHYGMRSGARKALQ